MQEPQEPIIPISINDESLAVIARRPLSFTDQDFPLDITVEEAYENLANTIPKKCFEARELILLSVCAVLAGLASYYNYAFGQAYVEEVANRWGFTDVSEEMGVFCGVAGFLVNTAINGRSLFLAYDVLKEIGKGIKNINAMPDDKNIRKFLLAMLGASVIGSLPNLKFVYDACKNNIGYLILMEGVQFLTMVALNLRGLYNTIHLNSEKKEIIRQFKKELLVNLNRCLLEKPLNETDVAALSNGILVRRNLTFIRVPSKWALSFYVGGYSASSYFAVKQGISFPPIMKVVDDLLNFGVTGCGLLASGLRWFLLGNAYSGLVERVFNLFQAPILKVGHKEIRSELISRNTQRLLVLAGVAVAVFSLGSASRIVEKYFFEGDEKTSEVFLLSLLIGGGAAFGINSIDFSTILERISNFVAGLFKEKFKGSEDKLEHLGESHDELIMRVMLEVATSSDNAFFDKYLKQFQGSPSDLEELGIQLLNQKAHSESIHLHGYYPEDNYYNLLTSCTKLRHTGNNLVFFGFKSRRSQKANNGNLHEASLLLTHGGP